MRDDEVDAARFMMALSRARVRWLLIGRQALVHYGVPAQTMDYDLWVDPAPANVGKLLRVAHALGLEAPQSASELETLPLFSLFGGSIKRRSTSPPPTDAGSSPGWRATRWPRRFPRSGTCGS